MAGRSRLVRVAVVPVALIVVAGACTGDDDATVTTPPAALATATTDSSEPAAATVPDDTTAPTLAPASSTTSPVSVASSTTADTVSTTAPSSSAPAPGSTVDEESIDWFSIVDGILDRQLELSRDPSLAGVDELCVAESSCSEQWNGTIGFLLDRGARLEGGSRWQLDSVEFQGTANDVPLAEATVVTLIVRETVTEPAPSQLVGDDGSVVEELPPDDRFSPGQQVSRTMVLGRSVAAGSWRLVAESEPG